MQPSLVVPGSLLAGRYRLVDALDSRETGTAARSRPPAVDEPHWRARDELLGRAVALHLIPRGPHTGGVLAGARAAARIPGPQIVRVLDVLDAEHLTPGESEHFAGLVITEWVPGEDLETVLLREGPLPDSVVRTIGMVLGDGLCAIETLADPHFPVPRLTPSDVVLTADGARIVLDRHWGDAGADAAGHASVTAAERCGAVGYAALTARWPLPEATVLEPAPLGDTGRPRTPRQVRARVSSDLDEVVCRCLGLGSGPVPGAMEIAELFAAVPVAAPPEPEPVPTRATRWLLPSVVALVLAVGFGLLVWQLSRGVKTDTGDRPRPGTPIGTVAVSSPSPLRPVTAVGFDPLGNGEEGDGTLAIDGDRSTAWRTVAYLRRPDLGGLKSGVGLLLDLGAGHPLSRVTLSFSTPGTSVEVHTYGTRPEAAPSDPPVATLASAPAVSTLALPRGTTGRWVLIWLTKLPPAADRADAYRAELLEAGVLGTS